MKTRNKLGALLCALAMVLSLAACGGGGSMTSAEVVETIKAASEKLNTATSAQYVGAFEMAMTQDYGIEGMEPQDVNVTADMDISFFTDPMKAMGNIKLNAAELGGSMEFGVYAVQEDGVLTGYLGMMGSWMSSELDMSSFEDLKNNTLETDLYAENEASATKIGEETVGDVKATKYSMTFSGASLEKLMKEIGIIDSLSALGAEAEMVAELYTDMGDMTMYFFIDADGNLVRMEIDCLDMANKIVEKAMAMSAEMYGMEATGSTSFSKLIVTMDITNVDAVEDFEIPADVVEGAMSY